MTYRAETALPNEHLERATAGLRAELRHQRLAAGGSGLIDWTTLTVTGPLEAVGASGRTWSCWSATVAPQRIRQALPG